MPINLNINYTIFIHYTILSQKSKHNQRQWGNQQWTLS